VADLSANGWPIFLILGGRSFCAQALVVIARKQLNLNHISLYTVLQILSISIVDKKPILHAFHASNYTHEDVEESNQLNLWSLPVGQ